MPFGDDRSDTGDAGDGGSGRALLSPEAARRAAGGTTFGGAALDPDAGRTARAIGAGLAAASGDGVRVDPGSPGTVVVSTAAGDYRIQVTPEAPIAPGVAPVARIDAAAETATVRVSTGADPDMVRRAVVSAVAELAAGARDRAGGRRTDATPALVEGGFLQADPDDPSRVAADSPLVLGERDHGRIAELGLVLGDLIDAENAGDTGRAGQLRADVVGLAASMGLLDPDATVHRTGSSRPMVGADASAVRRAEVEARLGGTSPETGALGRTLGSSEGRAVLAEIRAARSEMRAEARAWAAGAAARRDALDRELTAEIDRRLDAGERPVFDRIIVGNGWAATLSFATMGRTPHIGTETDLPPVIAIGDQPQPWSQRGELMLGQVPSEFHLPGMPFQTADLAGSGTDFAPSSVFTSTVDAGRATAGMPSYHGRVTGLEVRPDGDLSWPDGANFRITVGGRTIYTATVDITGGPGPARVASAPAATTALFTDPATGWTADGTAPPTFLDADGEPIAAPPPGAYSRGSDPSQTITLGDDGTFTDSDGNPIDPRAVPLGVYLDANDNTITRRLVYRDPDGAEVRPDDLPPSVAVSLASTDRSGQVLPLFADPAGRLTDTRVADPDTGWSVNPAAPPTAIDADGRVVTLSDLPPGDYVLSGTTDGVTRTSDGTFVGPGGEPVTLTDLAYGAYVSPTGDRFERAPVFSDPAGLTRPAGQVPPDVVTALDSVRPGQDRPALAFGGQNLASAYRPGDRILVFGSAASGAWDVEQASGQPGPDGAAQPGPAADRTVEWTADVSVPATADPNLPPATRQLIEAHNAEPPGSPRREQLARDYAFFHQGGFNRRNTVPELGAFSDDRLAGNHRRLSAMRTVRATPDGRFQVEFADGDRETYDHVVLSIGQDPGYVGGPASLLGAVLQAGRPATPITGPRTTDGDGRAVDVIGAQAHNGQVRLLGSASVAPAVLARLGPPSRGQVPAQARDLPPDSNGIPPSIRSQALRIAEANRSQPRPALASDGGVVGGAVPGEGLAQPAERAVPGVQVDPGLRPEDLELGDDVPALGLAGDLAEDRGDRDRVVVETEVPQVGQDGPGGTPEGGHPAPVDPALAEVEPAEPAEVRGGEQGLEPGVTEPAAAEVEGDQTAQQRARGEVGGDIGVDAGQDGATPGDQPAEFGAPGQEVRPGHDQELGEAPPQVGVVDETAQVTTDPAGDLEAQLPAAQGVGVGDRLPGDGQPVVGDLQADQLGVGGVGTGDGVGVPQPQVHVEGVGEDGGVQVGGVGHPGSVSTGAEPAGPQPPRNAGPDGTVTLVDGTRVTPAMSGAALAGRPPSTRVPVQRVLPAGALRNHLSNNPIPGIFHPGRTRGLTAPYGDTPGEVTVLRFPLRDPGPGEFELAEHEIPNRAEIYQVHPDGTETLLGRYRARDEQWVMSPEGRAALDRPPAETGPSSAPEPPAPPGRPDFRTATDAEALAAMAASLDITAAGVIAFDAGPSLPLHPERLRAVPGHTTVAAHTSPDGHVLVGGLRLTAEQFGMALNTLAADGRIDLGPAGAPLRLVMCRFAAGPGAATVAAVTGRPVRAATEMVWAWRDGSEMVAPADTGRSRMPSRTERGEWLTIDPDGAVVASEPGDRTIPPVDGDPVPYGAGRDPPGPDQPRVNAALDRAASGAQRGGGRDPVTAVGVDGTRLRGRFGTRPEPAAVLDTARRALPEVVTRVLGDRVRQVENLGDGRYRIEPADGRPFEITLDAADLSGVRTERGRDVVAHTTRAGRAAYRVRLSDRLDSQVVPEALIHELREVLALRSGSVRQRLATRFRRDSLTRGAELPSTTPLSGHDQGGLGQLDLHGADAAALRGTGWPWVRTVFEAAALTRHLGLDPGNPGAAARLDRLRADGAINPATGDLMALLGHQSSLMPAELLVVQMAHALAATPPRGDDPADLYAAWARAVADLADSFGNPRFAAELTGEFLGDLDPTHLSQLASRNTALYQRLTATLPPGARPTGRISAAELRHLAGAYPAAGEDARIAIRRQVAETVDRYRTRRAHPAADRLLIDLPPDVRPFLDQLAPPTLTPADIQQAVAGPAPLRAADFARNLTHDGRPLDGPALRDALDRLAVRGERAVTGLPRFPHLAGQVIRPDAALMPALAAVNPALAHRVWQEGLYVDLRGLVDLTPYAAAGFPAVTLGPVGAHMDAATPGGRAAIVLDDMRRAEVTYRAAYRSWPQLGQVLATHRLQHMADERTMLPVPAELADLVAAMSPAPAVAPATGVRTRPGASDVRLIPHRAETVPTSQGEVTYGDPLDSAAGRMPLWQGRPTRAQFGQGSLGDCGTIATIRAVAERRPAALGQAVRDNGDGTYTVRLAQTSVIGGVVTPAGGHTDIVLDGRLPVLGGDTRRFAYGRPAGAAWGPLLENALASVGQSWDMQRATTEHEAWYASQLHASQQPGSTTAAPGRFETAPTGYHQIVGAPLHRLAEMMAQLTGHPAHVTRMDTSPDREAVMLQRLRDLIAAGSPIITCTMGEDFYTDPDLPYDLVLNHAYEVVSVNPDGTVTLSNPWNSPGDEPSPVPIADFVRLMADALVHLDVPATPAQPAPGPAPAPHVAGPREPEPTPAPPPAEAVGPAGRIAPPRRYTPQLVTLDYYVLRAPDGSEVGVVILVSRDGAVTSVWQVAGGAGWQQAAGPVLPAEAPDARPVPADRAAAEAASWRALRAPLPPEPWLKSLAG